MALGTLGLTVYLYVVIPKGFFPEQDTGVIQGISQAAAVHFLCSDVPKAAGNGGGFILQDPAVESLSSFIGADGTNTTLNSGRISINLKPLSQRRNLSAADVIRRLKMSLQRVQGMTVFMQPVQNITVDDRVARTQYQFTLESPNSQELNAWTDKFVSKLKGLRISKMLPPISKRGTLALPLDRSCDGIAPGNCAVHNRQYTYDAYGQRQINTLYTQINQYHVVLETQPQWQQNPANLRDLYIQANVSSGATGSGAVTSYSSSASPAAGSNATTTSVLYTPRLPRSRRL